MGLIRYDAFQLGFKLVRFDFFLSKNTKYSKVYSVNPEQMNVGLFYYILAHAAQGTLVSHCFRGFCAAWFYTCFLCVSHLSTGFLPVFATARHGTGRQVENKWEASGKQVGNKIMRPRIPRADRHTVGDKWQKHLKPCGQEHP